MSNKHERFTTAVNESTGDLIKTKSSNQQAYADNWERIFGKKENTRLQGFRQDEMAVVVVADGYGESGVDTSFKEELLLEGIIGDEV